MILTDINLLLYAHNTSDERFDRASAWFESLLNGTDLACFCWETLNGFIRIATNPAAMPDPLSLDEAFTTVQSWLDLPTSVLLSPAADHLDTLRKLSTEVNAVGKLYSDAVLAAYAISHNVTLASTDRHFRLFDGLKLIDPLAI